MKARALNMKHTKNRMVSFVLALAMLMVMMPARTEAAVSLPSISSGTPLKAYGLKTGNNTRTYSDVNLSKGIGYIYASDLVTITSVRKNGNGVWVCYGYYPVSKGNKWAYWHLSDMSTQSAPSEKNTSRASMTVYRRSSGSSTVGSIAKGDTVYRMTEANGRTQVIYNLGSASRPTGWKMGWIPTTSYNSSIRQVNNSTNETVYYVTTTAGLILRKGAGTGYAKIVTMPYASAIKVSSISNGWAKASYNGYSGYCSSSYISRTKPGSSNSGTTQSGKKITVFKQTDYLNSYGQDDAGRKATLKSGGCGVFALVNAVYYLNGKKIDPITLANFALNTKDPSGIKDIITGKPRYLRYSGGTSDNLAKVFCNSHGSSYGIRYVCSVTNLSGASSYIKNGYVAVIHVQGHFMALVDYDASSGKYLVLDSCPLSDRGTSSGYRWMKASEFTGKMALQYIHVIGRR